MPRKPNYQFEKRQKELERKNRKEEKAQRRQERADAGIDTDLQDLIDLGVIPPPTDAPATPGGADAPAPSAPTRED